MFTCSSLQAHFARFWRDETGVATIEFVIVFPVFFGFFLMTVESGLIALRHVMLERGVDVTVREVRLGAMPNPTRALLRERVCEVAGVIPDCESLIEIEMTEMSPTVQSDWDNYDPRAECVDRGNLGASSAVVDTVGNNSLMLIRACVRIDPFLPTSVLGKTIIRENDTSEAGGAYSLVSMAAFVIEPYMTSGF